MSDQKEHDGDLDNPERDSGKGEGEILEAEVTEVAPEGEGETRPKVAKSGAPPIALILALVALGGVAATLGIGYQQLKTYRASLLQMDAAISQAGQRQAALQTELEKMHQQYQEQQQALESQKALFASQAQKLAEARQRIERQGQAMQQTLEQVYQRVGRSSTEWIAAEAEYLMRVANHRLQLESDVQTAVKALQAADNRLRDTGDPGWIGVREQLAAEISELKGIGQVDRAGLAAQLTAMGEQVQKLKIVGVEPAPRQAPERSTVTQPGERSLETLVRDGWEGFKSLMVIRHHGKPLTAMLSPDQQFYVYQNLRLQFEAARLALLRADQLLFDTSLRNAEQWINDLFDTSQGDTAALLQQIRELKEVQVHPALPDISGSLMALRERLRATPKGDTE